MFKGIFNWEREGLSKGFKYILFDGLLNRKSDGIMERKPEEFLLEMCNRIHYRILLGA